MKRLVGYSVVGLVGMLVAWPFFWMILTSFKSLEEATRPGAGLFPSVWQWGNLAQAWRAAPFGRYFFNSFLVAFLVAGGVMFTSLMAGYAFARLSFRGRGVLFALVLATMMVPFEVTLIPNFVLVGKLGWYNRYPALIVPWCANAFSIFLMRQAFMGLPQDFFDAARIDGCGHVRFLLRIGAPLVRSAWVTVGVFAFLGSYNALLWPLVVTTDDAMRVVQVGLLAFSGEAGIQLNLLMCAATIVIAPTVVLYALAQRYIVSDSLQAGIKG